jgi:hypothetical protein
MKQYSCYFIYDKSFPHHYILTLRPNPKDIIYNKLYEQFFYYDKYEKDMLICHVIRYYYVCEYECKDTIDYDCISLPNEQQFKIVKIKPGLFDPKKPEKVFNTYKRYTLLL